MTAFGRIWSTIMAGNVPLVFTKLLPGDGKWRARQTTRDDVHALEVSRVELGVILGGHIMPDDVPFRSVQQERSASVFVEFDQAQVDPRLFVAESLTASTSAVSVVKPLIFWRYFSASFRGRNHVFRSSPGTTLEGARPDVSHLHVLLIGIFPFFFIAATQLSPRP